nr:MAG TPA: hypothetical protein [Caudoviricetes sp.]
MGNKCRKSVYKVPFCRRNIEKLHFVESCRNV